MTSSFGLAKLLIKHKKHAIADAVQVTTGPGDDALVLLLAVLMREWVRAIVAGFGKIFRRRVSRPPLSRGRFQRSEAIYALRRDGTFAGTAATAVRMN